MPGFVPYQDKLLQFQVDMDGTRATRTSSTIWHSTVSPSKMKKPLTTIPEAPLHETSPVPRQTCIESPVQDRLEPESLPSLVLHVTQE
jgi:hypothetical protein